METRNVVTIAMTASFPHVRSASDAQPFPDITVAIQKTESITALTARFHLVWNAGDSNAGEVKVLPAASKQTGYVRNAKTSSHA